jgi:hypothetical protein
MVETFKQEMPMTNREKEALEPEPRRESNDHAAYSVVLPCAPEEFTEFISGLLGKAQTIEQVFTGPFEVHKNDIVNTYHLVNQRVNQQNAASLVQFTVKIVYDDDSSVLLNSLEDFRNYSEIRSLVSMAAYLSWTYLIKFQDKRFPEKQQIELAIVTEKEVDNVVQHTEDGIVIHRRQMYGRNHILLRVNHTARTWGVDIESLLAGHINTWLIPEKGLKKFISNHSGPIGFSFGLGFFVLSMLGAYFTASRLVTAQVAAAKSLLESHGSAATSIAGKIDFLVQAAAQGAWPRFALGLSGFFFASIVLAIIAGAWVGTAAENSPSSFLLISKKAEERKVEVLEAQQRTSVKFIASLIMGVSTGLVANIIFAKLFPAWVG